MYIKINEGGERFFSFASKCVLTPKALVFLGKKLQHNRTQKQMKFQKINFQISTIMGLDIG
jgi:hypothetical protein